MKKKSSQIDGFLILSKKELNLINKYSPQFKFQEDLNSGYKIFYNSFFYKKNSNNNKQFIFGNIFLRYLSKKNSRYNSSLDPKYVIKNPSNFEGNFIFINSKKNQIEIKTDSKGIFDVFYLKGKNNIISDSFELLTKIAEKLTLNNHSIFHSLITIAKRPPKQQTFFNEISRLDLDEKIIMSSHNSIIKKSIFKPLKIKENITEKELLNNYDKYLNNYVASVGNQNNNKIIFMSSGWDSLMVVEKLCKTYKKIQIKPVIARLKFSNRSKIFNKYEIIKAKKICKIYGLRLKIIDIDYKNYKKYLKELNPIVTKKMLLVSDASFLHSRIINESLKKFSNGDFFSGEISDGVHNFGFSQYCTLLDHENNGYREYADKMMTYLFGPTFLKKVIEGKHQLDPIYKLLKEKLGIKTFKIKKKLNAKKIIKIFLESMFLPDKRFPLKANISNLIKKKAELKIKNNFYKDYLKNIKISDFREIYSLYIYLYNKFHWQGSTVNPAFAFTCAKNNNMANLFWDKNIHKLLSTMPEKYGRGLDIGYVKYPSKKLISKKVDIADLNKFPHSYLSDYSNFDSNYELLFHSKMRDYIKDVFKTHNPAIFLDKNFFNIKHINVLLKKFYSKQKNTSAKEATLIYSLFCVSKILKDLNFKY